MKTQILQDKVIVVAGGAGGIGTAISMYLASRGATIVIANRSNNRMLPLLHELRKYNRESVSFETDLCGCDGWRSLFQIVCQKFQHLDVLVNCVGVLLPGSLDSLAYQDIEHVVASNFLSVVHGTKAAVSLMKPQHYGNIINIGSLGGIVPMPFESLYSATKFAVRGFSLSMSQELKDTGINLSLISPGSVSTKMLDVEASDDRSTMSFIQRPLNPLSVAKAVLDLIEKPRKEIILPSPTKRFSLLINLFPNLFGLCYPALNYLGKRHLKQYRERNCRHVQLTPLEE